MKGVVKGINRVFTGTLREIMCYLFNVIMIGCIEIGEGELVVLFVDRLSEELSY